MPISLRRAALAFSLLLMPATLAAQETQQPATAQQDVTRTTHGAWIVTCANTSNACIMEQVGKDSVGKDMLLMAIQRIQPQTTPEGTVDMALIIRVPLGVMLQPGLAIQIDGGQEIRGPFTQCSPKGCVLQSPLPPAMVASMKKGVVAKIMITGPNDTQMTSDISLSGFTAAINSLKK